MEGERPDRRGVETDRGAQGQRVGRLVVEHDAAGVGAGRVGQHPHGGLQPVGQVEVGCCGAIDAAERGEPGQRRVADVRIRCRWRISPSRGMTSARAASAVPAASAVAGSPP